VNKSAMIATMLSALLIATAAEANPKGNNGNGHGNAQSSNDKCPPGLAKKGPGCVPPGQAKLEGTGTDTDGTVVVVPDYLRGDRLPDDYVVMIDPRTYPIGPNADFVRYGDFLYLIDRNSGNVLNQLGHVSDWGWTWSETDFDNCPPGLAKKNPPCVPPGLAKPGNSLPSVDPYGVGGRLPSGYRVMINPQYFDGSDNTLYARRGDSLYRIDRQNNQVLDLIGSIADLFR